jgi:hypothetical protein
MKSSDVNDVDLEPGAEYNLTSAYGCYRNSIVDGVNQYYNPDALSESSALVETFPKDKNGLDLRCGPYYET